MNRYTVRTIRFSIYLAGAATVLAGSSTAIAGSQFDGDDNRPASANEEVAVPHPDPAPTPTPIYVEVLERARLREAVDQMPAGWPATEIMRRQIEAPLGDATDRREWRETADRMPAGWPATEATRQSGAEGTG